MTVGRTSAEGRLGERVEVRGPVWPMEKPK